MDTYKKIKILHRLKLFNAIRSSVSWLQSFNQKKRKFFGRFIQKGDLVFDIGANIGQMTDVFLRLGARVICVEPQTEVFKFLQSKYRYCTNVVLINKAVDSQGGLKKEMYLCEANALSSLSSNYIEDTKNSGRYAEYQWGGVQFVSTITLDELIKEYGKPIFCKVDVEGYELNVLNGLTQAIDYLSFEIAPESIAAAQKCIHHLAQIGRIKINISADAMNMKFSGWVSPDEFLDWLNSISGEQVYGDVYVYFER